MRALQSLVLASAMAIACQRTPPGADAGAPPTQASQPSGVTIALDRTSYSRGDRVQLSVTNHTTDQLGYNPCTRSIERQQGTGWSLIVEPGRVCTMQLYLLNAHTTRTDPTELPPNLNPGTYRIALAFTRESPGANPQTATPIRVVSAPFQVN